MPCLLRLDTIIVKRSPICCSSAQTFGLVGQFGLNVDSPSITCFGCAALITCSTRLHLLLICSISLLCSRLCPPIRDKPTIALVAMSNSIWKPIPIDSNGPKVKVNLTVGAYWSKQWQLAEDGLQLSWFEPKFMEAKGRNGWTWVWRTSRNSWQLSPSSKCSCQGSQPNRRV